MRREKHEVHEPGKVGSNQAKSINWYNIKA